MGQNRHEEAIAFQSRYSLSVNNDGDGRATCFSKTYKAGTRSGSHHCRPPMRRYFISTYSSMP
jgi:hypothetical protein